jgi:hypothetical protein
VFVDLFGSFALLLAFVCAVYAIGVGIAAILSRRPLLNKSARQAGMAVCVLISLAMGSLVYLFLTDNFSLAYVVGIFLPSTNSPRCGQVKKARYCFGAGCFRSMSSQFCILIAPSTRS